MVQAKLCLGRLWHIFHTDPANDHRAVSFRLF